MMKRAIRNCLFISLSLLQLASASTLFCMDPSRAPEKLRGSGRSWLSTVLGTAALGGAAWFAYNKWIRNKQTSRDPIIPIVYDPGYNISFFGVENFHSFNTNPFDTKKYGNIFNYVAQACGIHPEQIYRYHKLKKH